MLAERDHVAHVEVVGRDRRVVLQRETQVEQRLGTVVDPAHEHALVADVEQTGLHERPRRLGHQRRHRVRVVDVSVDRDVHAPGPRLRGDPAHALDDVWGAPVLGQGHQGLRCQADVTDVVDL
jgi:hypothetical protein